MVSGRIVIVKVVGSNPGTVHVRCEKTRTNAIQKDISVH